MEIKTSFSKTHLLRPLLLKRFQQVNARYKIDEIVNKFLLIMHQIHLKQDGFKCIACRPVTKNKERIQIFQEWGDSRYIYQNRLNKACFKHDMA